MNTNLEDYEGVIDRIANNFKTPGVSGVYQLAERRYQKRRTIQQGAAVLTLLLVATTTATLWINQPQTSEVATESPGIHDDATQTSTTSEEAMANASNELRDLFISTRRWRPIARTGIPETSFFEEHVVFYQSSGSDGIALQSCMGAPPHIIDWHPDGFAVTGIDVETANDTRGCEAGQEGIANTPVQVGEKVVVANNSDGTYTLTGDTWELTITPVTQAPIDPSLSNTTTTTTIFEIGG